MASVSRNSVEAQAPLRAYDVADPARLTEQQVNANPRLKRLAITKLDNRYKPAKEYEAIECEALGQGVLIRIIRKHLDNLLREPLGVVRERERVQRERARHALLRIRRRS